MNGLRMLWFTSGTQLVCRWVDAEDTQVRPEEPGVETAAADVIELPTAAIGKAA